MSDCTPCPDPTCACPLPECADVLIIGSAAPDTDYYVHVVKSNGARFIHPTISDNNGQIAIYLNEPSEPFYNRFDGEYRIYVMGADGYSCEDEKVEITSGTTTWTTAAVTFEESNISYTTINLKFNA